jgi:nucleoside recognition membrane protein YjiH
MLGLGFFVVPVPQGDRWTVVFDVVVKSIRGWSPNGVSVYCLLLVLAGAILTFPANRRARDGSEAPRDSLLGPFVASPGFTVTRVLGALCALSMVTGVGPEWLLEPRIGGLIWGTLVASVGLIIPLGAVALNLFVGYGCLEWVGGLMRPIMRPLFRLPGRAALDDLVSWLGSYSVGLYLTRRLVDQGRYTRREAFIIATCFSTVSIGFVGVVASTLNLLSLFPLVFGTYFVVTYLVAVLQVRCWPTLSVPDVTVGPADPEPEEVWSPSGAWASAMERAATGPPMPQVALQGLRDGLLLAATILGTILSVGTAALLVNHHTPLFTWLGRPLEPVLFALGFQEARMLAPAVVAGITEMYIPALLVRDASTPARFFICVLSISQLVFFSSVAPMMLEMFRDVPIRVRDLLAIFVFRTAVLVPLLAGVTWALVASGVL